MKRLYANAALELLKGSTGTALDLLGEDLKIVFVDTDDYTPDFENDALLSDIPGAARVATSTALQNPSIAGGFLDADDINVASVTGDEFEAFVVYQVDTGDEEDSVLLFYSDETAQLPITPNGLDILVTFDATGIFSLVPVA